MFWIRSSPYLNDQGLLPDGTYMCLDGKARTGDWEKAKRLVHVWEAGAEQLLLSKSLCACSPRATVANAPVESWLRVCFRENPDDLAWLTEWVVAARTGQLEKAKGK